MSWILDFILQWVWTKLLTIVGGFLARFKKREQIQKDAEKSVEPLKKAETAQEIDDAADDALDGL